MNINNIYNMVSTIKKFMSLLKEDMNIETLNKIREIKGNEVLENYEKMFETDALGTKNILKNYIINEINSISSNILEISTYDNQEIKDFAVNGIKLPNIDHNKIVYVVDKGTDNEAWELVSHKLSVAECLTNLLKTGSYLNHFEKDEDIKVKFKYIIDNYNIILNLIEKSVKDDKELFSKEVESMTFGFGLDGYDTSNGLTDIKSIYNFLLNNHKKISTVIGNNIEDVKDGIPDIDYKPSLSKELKENLMRTVDDYAKDIINGDTYEYLFVKQIELIEFYVRTVICYIESIVSYVEHIRTYVTHFETIDNSINTAYQLFYKSE